MAQEHTERQTNIRDGIPASLRSCSSCVHNVVCEARRTLVRSYQEFDKAFEFVDAGVLISKQDELAQSCQQYKSPVTDDMGGR